MNRISKDTRNKIFDLLRYGVYKYTGRLDDISFLKCLYDLELMNSIFYQCGNLEDEIFYYITGQISLLETCDISEWVLKDYRFGLSDGEDRILLNFLCKIFDPFVRVEEGEWAKLLCQVNKFLKVDRYEIYENSTLSDRAIYCWRLFRAGNRITGNSIISEQSKNIAEIINTEYVRNHIEKMRNLIDSSPDDAIGKAKELLEIVSKSILDDLGGLYDKNDNVSKLMKKACEAINLTPGQIPQDAKGAEIASKILGSLSGITHGMVELRNEFGGGHGKSKNFKPLPPRYAHLAVGAAVTAVKFMWDTYTERKSSNNS